MLSNRICVIGLPRCGSQYTVELIKNNGYYPYYDLIEPFQKNKPYVAVNKLNNLYLIHEECDEQYRITNTINFITTSDINQSLILRVFPVNEQKGQFENIITTLINKNFDFIVLKRANVEYHLLSFGVALSTDIWTKFSGTIIPPKVKITHFDEMRWLYKQILNFNEMIENFSFDYDLLKYETIEQDLSTLFGNVINKKTKVYKQADYHNPYNNISNVDDVKTFFNKLFQ